MAADRPELVKTLHDQAIAFHLAGRHAEAVTAWAEALAVRIPLAAVDHKHKAYLASARRYRAEASPLSAATARRSSTSTHQPTTTGRRRLSSRRTCHRST